MAPAIEFNILLLLLLQLVTRHMGSKLSDLKKCGDPECERYLSRVQATMDYTGPDCRFLTFKSGDSILVYFKLTGKRADLWSGSIGMQFGYFPKDAVKVEDVFVSIELELPTKESDFLCLDGGGYYIESEESNSVSDEYGESSFSKPEEMKATLRHESKPNKYNQDYKGNSAKDEPMDNLMNFYKEQFQRTHLATDDTELEMNSGKEQLQKSRATAENAQINEFLSPADHLNELSEESVSKLTNNNEPNLATGPESVYSEYSGTKDEHAGQKLSEDTAIASESNEESKFVQVVPSWIGSRIRGWFALESNENKKVVEPTDQSIQLNSFKSRKIALDYGEDTAMSEMIDKRNNDMYYKDKENLGSEKSGWIGGLSKLLSFNSDSPENILSTNDDEKDEHENVKSFSVDSTDPSKTTVTKLENKMSDHSVPEEVKLTSSRSEKTTKNTDKDNKQNLMDSERSTSQWFDLSDKLWIDQINKAENSGISEETQNIGEENTVDNDESQTWWLHFNTLRDTFRFGENSRDQTSRKSEETQNFGEDNKDYTRDTDGSKSRWFHFGLSETLGFGQSNEDYASSLPEETKENIDEDKKENTLDNDESKSQWFHFGLSDTVGQTNEDHLASDPLEETKKSIIKDNKENTMNNESEDSSPILVVNHIKSEGDTLIVDSVINEDTIQSPELSLCTTGNDISCQSKGLQQPEREYTGIKSENPQSVFSVNGLKNSFSFEGITSKLQGVQELKVQHLQEQNLMPGSKFVGHNKPSTQENLHEEQSLQEHLKFTSEIKQPISDDIKSVTYENIQMKEKLHEQEVLHNQDLISSVKQFSIVSNDEPLVQESLCEEGQHLKLDSELTPAGDPSSENTLLTVADTAELSAWDKLQDEETLQHNLESRLESKQLISNATDSVPLNTLQNKEKFSEDHLVIKSDFQQITIADSDRLLPEETLHHEQQISQQQHVISTMEFEQLDISDNDKLLSQAQTNNGQQNFNSEFGELTTSGQVIPSQNELWKEEAITHEQHLTSAKQQISDHYNFLSEMDKEQVLKEMHPSSLDDKQVTITNTDDHSLQKQLHDETQRVQSLQPASDHTGALSQEKLYNDRNALQQQSLALESESNQLTSDHREAQSLECLHGEEHVFKECLPIKSESNQAAPDADQSFSLKKHDEQDLQEQQANSASESNWLATSDHSKHALSEKLHVNEEILQANVLTPLHSEQGTGSDKDKLLLQEKLKDKESVLQKQCITSDLTSKLPTITDNVESLLQDSLQDKEQTLPDPLSSLESEAFTVSYDVGKTLTRENSFYQQKSLEEDKGVTLKSEKKSVVLDATEDFSQEGTIVTKVSTTTINTEKRNQQHRSTEPESVVELVNSLLSENMDLLGVDFGGDDGADTKIKPQQVVEETARDKMSDNYRQTNNLISEKATSSSIDPVSANLWKDEVQSNSEKLIVTSTHESKDTSKLSTDVEANPDATAENIVGATSTITENKSEAGDVAPTSRDIESNGHQTSSFSFWGVGSLLDEAKKQFEKLRVEDTSFDSSNLKFLRKHMSIAQLQYLKRCFEKAKLLWLEETLEHLENENSSNGFNDILQKVTTFERSFLQNKDFKCDRSDANIEYRMIERQHSEDTEMFQKLQDILTAIKMKCTTNVSSSSTMKDAFSSADTLEAGLVNNVQSLEILDNNGRMSKGVREHKGTEDIISEVMERQMLETLTLNLSDKIPDSEKATVKAVMESKLENQLQKEPSDIYSEKTSYHKTEEKVMSFSTVNKDFDEVKKPSVTVDSRVGVATENNNEYETSVKKIAVHKLGNSFDLDLQTIRMLVDHFIKNFYQKVMDTLSENPGATSNLRGAYIELFLVPAVVGVVTALLFMHRTCQAIKSRRYLGREKQLAVTVSQLLDEKCKILETLSDCTQKYKEFEASVKNVADVKESTETRTLHLQDTYAKLDKSNDTLRQTIDQFTQDLEREKQTRSQHSNLIAEIQANLSALENEAQNLKVQVEEAKIELKGIQINDGRHQESFQAAKEENYHLKQSNEQLLQESEGWGERYSELTEHIKLGAKSQKDMQEVLASKENEVKSLTDCLLKMKLWNPDEEDNPAEGMSEERQKQKIEKLIYVAKLNAGLKSVEEERNQIHSKLSDEIKAKQELIERIEKLQLEQTSVQYETTQFETEYKTTQQKLKIMTELYHEKEMELQRKLTLEKHQRLQKEEKLSEVDEKINEATEELSLYRQRAKDLEEELVKTIQSYKNQIVSHEKKAHDNWLSAREADRELGNIKRENIHLRQKITEAEFKMDIALKDPLINDISGRPALLSPSTFVPPYRGRSSPYGPSPVGRPGSEPMGFLSPSLLDGPSRFSPLFPGRPDFKTKGPSVHPDHSPNENVDSVSDRMSDHHGPQSDSGSLSPVWERERKLLGASPDRRPTLENSMEISDSAPESQTQDRDTLNVSLNQSLPAEADFGIRPGFAHASPKQIPFLPVDQRGHFLHRGLPLPPRGGIYGPPERFPLRAFGLPPHPPMGMRDPVQPGAYLGNLPPPRPIFLPHRPLSDGASSLLPSRLPPPKFPATEHPPPSQEK
ncbi:cTAGE family member 5 isoform X2 [Heptranchias perlo]|uniref:cTAGE family member 5 isoform X2 n=1 Tax=Heptranchias perlo TaxID=212740 RepID=UPI00355A3DBE